MFIFISISLFTPDLIFDYWVSVVPKYLTSYIRLIISGSGKNLTIFIFLECVLNDKLASIKKVSVGKPLPFLFNHQTHILVRIRSKIDNKRKASQENTDNVTG